MSEFEFVDELPRGAYDKPADPLLAAFADSLRNNPGRWAKYPRPLKPSVARNVQWGIKNGKSPAPLPLRDGFEGATRNSTLYVRFKGRG